MVSPDSAGLVAEICSFGVLTLTDSRSASDSFDLVLIRNVMIYFDLQTKREILGKVRRVLRPDGALVLGGSESTVIIDESWKTLTCGKSVFYRI